MQTIYTFSHAPRSHYMTRPTHKSTSTRMLKACGFSRQELRAMVADMLG
ncbi:hypothetical protein Q1W73_08905 [Asticcacaulis sp. ZE23SCel15]|nr:hypothetical protein [Asticcacaulis sp. ZE23SCel15]WKL55826.1 hypothetical protein Q1W73_08905 [Asticcacaulis sp. ZE23SCel15]